jgi:hypothetical protein
LSGWPQRFPYILTSSPQKVRGCFKRLAQSRKLAYPEEWLALKAKFQAKQPLRLNQSRLFRTAITKTSTSNLLETGFSGPTNVFPTYFP